MFDKLVTFNQRPLFDQLFGEWDVSPHEKLFDKILVKTNPVLSKELGSNFFESGAFPKVDIRETESEFIIEAETPGLAKDQVKVEVKEDTLVIRGEKRSDEKKDGKYHTREIKRSSFSRAFTLPPEIVDKNTVQAKFQNGMLEVRIKKVKPTPPPKPDVKVIDIQ